jgi:PLD-like domain
MGNRNKLKIAENVSLGISFMGLAIAGVTQQFMFALAPLSLSLSIGTIRRQKLEKEAVERTQELTDIKNKIPATESLTYQDLDRVNRKIVFIESNISTRIDSIDNDKMTLERMENFVQNKIDKTLDRQFAIVKKIIPAEGMGGLIQAKIDESLVREFAKIKKTLPPEGMVESLQAQIDESVDRQFEMIKKTLPPEGMVESLQAQIDESVDRQFETIKQILPKQYNYNLVSDRTESRNIFLSALKESKIRLILVCPWVTEYGLDAEVKRLIVSALDRGVSIGIGWGHLKDVDNDRSRLSREQLLKSKSKKWYNAIPWLYELQNNYPRFLDLKILGTHEKFLVCDRNFAMVGSHNYLTSSNSTSERELGIKTNNPQIINEFIDRFDRYLLEPITQRQLKGRQTLNSNGSKQSAPFQAKRSIV